VTAELSFRVAGRPVTQGSKTGIVVGGRAVLVEKARDRLKPWREAVRSTALEHLDQVMRGEAWQPYPGPVHVQLVFALPKPASAPKTRRTWPTGARSGDVDKLARAVLDALTDAGVWRDDAQVVRLLVDKDYPGPHTQQITPGVLVQVTPAELVDAHPSLLTEGHLS
jgi:Holliday junction resolvase RusA-like endonuclease